MIKNRHLILFLLSLLLTTIACVTYANNQAATWGNGHKCVFTGSIDSSGTTEYQGTFRCTNPDESKLTCPYTNQPVDRAEFKTRVLITQMTEDNFWASLGCSKPVQATPTPRPTNTPDPTATNTPIPLLTGDISACSTKDGFINFKLVTNAPQVNTIDVHLSINGTQVNCTVAGSNKDLLSCPLPPGVTFPAQIHVALGNASVNDFAYDGSGCVAPAPGGGGDGGAVPTSCGVGDCKP